MVIAKELKLNRFQQVSIPKPSDMFARLGKRVTPANEYSGEEELIQGNKVEQLQQQMEMYERYAKEEAKKASENPD